MKSHDIDTRYLFLAFVLIFFDRLSKWFALITLQEPKHVTDFLSFELVLNRGISWGFLHSDKPYLFYLVTGAVVIIMGALLMHTIIQRINQQPIYGEVAVLAGACSNLVDRFVYGGVIDFIHFHYDVWSWPVFNIADVAIVLGIFWIIYEHRNA